MQTLVASISPQPNTTTSELETTDWHPSSHELPFNNGDTIRNVTGTVSPIHELGSSEGVPSNAWDLPAELSTNDHHSIHEADSSSIHELQITAEETMAVEEIFAEAKQRFIESGRPAPIAIVPSRANTVTTKEKKNPLAIVPPRKPIPLHSTHGRYARTTSIPTPAMLELPEETQTPPVPAKIPIYEPSPPRNEKFSNSETLASSINYKPSPAIEKLMLNYISNYSGTTSWPLDFKTWLRVGEWWFLKVETIPSLYIYILRMPLHLLAPFYLTNQ